MTKGAENRSPKTRKVRSDRVNEEAMAARFPAGTFARIDAARAHDESRADFLRQAVKAELLRRERGAQPPPTDPPPKPARAPVPPKTSEAAKSPKEVDAQPPAQAQDSGARRAKGYDPVTGKAYY